MPKLIAKSYLTEAKKGKPYEIFIGRFQPLHLGHATVIGKMKNPVVALVKGGKTSQNKEKNPLGLKDQARMIKKAYPKAKIIEVSTGYIPEIAMALRKQGFELSAIWAGEDRRASYVRQMDQFNAKSPAEKEAAVTVKGPTELFSNFDWNFKRTFNPDGERIGGTSATLVRNAIREGDKETFLKHMPKKLHPEWDFLRKKIK